MTAPMTVLNNCLLCPGCSLVFVVFTAPMAHHYAVIVALFVCCSTLWTYLLYGTVIINDFVRYFVLILLLYLCCYLVLCSLILHSMDVFCIVSNE
jgi:hypothetical protein